jgi:hypothetical protein
MDLYGGGARYNIFGPCFTGLSCIINSLWVIKELVYNKEIALMSLTELRDALLNNWGYSMTEPFYSTLIGESRLQQRAERFQYLRSFVMAMPKYGMG